MADLVTSSSSAIDRSGLDESTRRAEERVPLSAAMRVVNHFVYNLGLLKARVLGSMDVPLSPDEERVILEADDAALARVCGSALEELKLVEDELRRSAPAAALMSSSTLAVNPSVAAGRALRPVEGPESRVAESVNAMYRFVFEELALRWHSCEDERNAKLAPQRTLSLAVEHQRKLAEAAEQRKDVAEKRLQTTNTELDAAKRRVAQLEAEKKADFDSYIKEVCCLKEQLYRSYKDKDYVGKPVDILRLVHDKDTAEDVSVDSLLDARRQMRNAEREAEAMKERINSLMADVSSKTRLVKRVEERLQASETIAAALQADVERLNEHVTKQEQLLNLARSEAATMQTRVQVFEQRDAARLASQVEAEMQTVPEPKEISRFDIGAEQIPTPYRDRSRLKLYTAFAEQEKLVAEVRAESERLHAEAKSRIAQLEKDIVEVKDKLDEALTDLAVAKATIEARDKEIAELKEANVRLAEEAAQAKAAEQKAIAERDEALEAKRIAEERAEAAVLQCATQSQQLSTELQTCSRALEVSQRRNTALSQAFVNISERLEEIKTRAGLKDYKRRANEFHFKRAEAAIQAMREEMAAHEAECRQREAEAAGRVVHAREMMRFMEEDLAASARVHDREMQAMRERTRSVQEAFEALLADFNRLRDDYLKISGGALAGKAVEWNNVIHSSDFNKPAGGGADDADSEEKDKGPQQQFIFEVGTASAIELLKYAETLAGTKMPGLSAADPAEQPGSDEDVDTAEMPGASAASVKTVNAAASNLAQALAITYAQHFKSAADTWLEMLRSDKFLETKERAIKNAEATASRKQQLAASRTQRSGGSSSKASRKSMAEEHSRFQANRTVQQEKAGLQQQRVANAWNNIRLLQELDLSMREAVAKGAELISSVHVVPPPADDEAPVPERAELQVPSNEERASDNDTAAASSTAAPTPQQHPHAPTASTPATPLVAPHDASSPSVLPGLPGAAHSGLSASELDAPLPAVSALLQHRATKRSGSAPGTKLPRKSVSQWGGVSGPRGLRPLPAVSELPDVLRKAQPASSDEGASKSTLSRQLVTHASDSDANLGDFETIADHLEKLRETVSEGRKSRGGKEEPAWQRQKNLLRRALRETAVDAGPTLTTKVHGKHKAASRLSQS